MLSPEERRKETVLSKYNVNNVAQLPEVQAKRKQTFESKRQTINMYQPPRTNIVDGRQLETYKLDKGVADKWLNRYHPMKAPRGNVLCLGLVDNTTIYCMMTFKKSRNRNYTAELSRMWMLPAYQVTDGYDILSQVAAEFGIDRTIAYVNRSFERASDYQSIGMSYIRDIQPTKWWIKNNQFMSDASRRQKHLSVKNMTDSGWYYAYDCGQAVYVFE